MKLLGAPWALLGGPLEQLLRFGCPLGTALVTILVFWGALWRSHGSLGTTWVVILMVFMSKPSSGHNFDGFDVQITKKLFQNLSNAAPITFARLIGICHVLLAFVSMICISLLHILLAPLFCSFASLIMTYHDRRLVAPLSFTCRVQLSFSPPM